MVVVVDVLRAFSTEAVAFERGAAEIIPAGTVEEALRWKQRDPDVLVMGEVNGYRVSGFDLWNSPSELLTVEVAGRRLIHRSTAGTQGILCARGASLVLAASFMVASATARYLKNKSVRQVDFIITGRNANRDGDEDEACADFIASLLNDRAPDAARAAGRVRESRAGLRFKAENPPEAWLADLELCLQIDRCNFVMRVFSGPEGLVVRKILPGS